MPADPIPPAAALARQSLIAPLWHTLSVLLIFGFFSFRDAQQAQNAAPSSAIAPHGAVIRAYLLMIFYEWGMAAWAWGGAQFKGGNLRTLTGGRWTSWRSLARDVATAIPFWGVWELTARLVPLPRDRVQTTPN